MPWISKVIVLISLLLTGTTLYAQLQVPPLTGRVIDQTGILRDVESRALNDLLVSIENKTGAQIALLIVSTIRPEPIEQYAIRVAENWKLGQKGVDNGVLVLVAKEDRELRIEVGYGLEGVVTDFESKQIIDRFIVPRFKLGQYYLGLKSGIERLQSLISGDGDPSFQQPVDKTKGSDSPFLILVILGLLTVIFLTPFLGRFTAAAVGSILSILIGLFVTAIMSSILVGLVVFIFGSSITSKRGLRGGRYIGGNSRGGFGSGGGFSGGGGSFGGGGASGRW